MQRDHTNAFRGKKDCGGFPGLELVQRVRGARHSSATLVYKGSFGTNRGAPNAREERTSPGFSVHRRVCVRTMSRGNAAIFQQTTGSRLFCMVKSPVFAAVKLFRVRSIVLRTTLFVASSIIVYGSCSCKTRIPGSAKTQRCPLWMLTGRQSAACITFPE